jgi:hypothetical protein
MSLTGRRRPGRRSAMRRSSPFVWYPGFHWLGRLIPAERQFGRTRKGSRKFRAAGAMLMSPLLLHASSKGFNRRCRVSVESQQSCLVRFDGLLGRPSRNADGSGSLRYDRARA